ncbi:glycoside hydrolase family 108 protein [Segnochrobactrum spirostomi]|uniref:Uncharacterized protein n=1 Tax=Segnochrobactrum spirostomi TaxID=2608987 RepID=A0A6A7Y6S6_9HYPH|nr:glycosyl hydrolase 108 family protein [Segnochrobactrum spirostomi]MQT14405.1 hypothetical protein [Segnochrobactrum spirostomi]
MTAANFSACLAITLGHEGGYSSERADPGNWTGGKVGRGLLRGTKFGISAAAYPTLNITALTPADAARIYAADYWRPVQGDALPAGVDLATFDYAVNSGLSRAVKALQSSAGAKADGDFGPLTLEAVEKSTATKAATIAIVGAICDRRLAFLRSLKTWGTFGAGWAKRVGDVRARGQAMAGAGADVISLSVARDLRTAATRDKQSAASGAGGGVSGAGAAGKAAAAVSAADAAQATTIDWSAVAALGIVAAILITIAIVVRWRAGVHRDVAAGASAALADLQARGAL